MRRELVTVAVSLLVAMAAGSVLIMAYGQSPARVYGELLAHTWGNAYGIGQVLFGATPLIFTGLAVSVGFRVGLFNIGAEGQMELGMFATALVGAQLPPSTPAPIAIASCVAAGMVAGGLLGAIPGVLRARFGAHEVINTIMLNFIASALVLWIGRRWLFEQETTHTALVIEAARLPGLGLGTSAANACFALAVVAAVATWYWFARTRRGFEWRAVGHNAEAARAAGVGIGAAIVGAMTASGALAGAVGANHVLGYKHYFEQGMAEQAGFMGIAVALLGRNHPAGVVAAALLFGTLSQGGLAVSDLVPKEIVGVLQGVIILAVAATSGELRRLAPRGGTT